MSNISNTDDIIDLRAVSERIEELEESLQQAHVSTTDGPAAYSNLEFDDWIEAVRADFSAAHAHECLEEADELAKLQALMEDLKGRGGDHDWRGDWYPLLLIRDSHFQDYAQELAEDIGAVNRDESWPHNCIDWEEAAAQLRVDYTAVEFNGVTYWCR